MPSSRPASPTRAEPPLAGGRRRLLPAVWVAGLAAVLVGRSTSFAAQPEAEGNGPGEPVAPEPARAPVLLLVRTQGDTGVMNRLRTDLERTAYSLVEIRLDERRGPIPLAELGVEQRAAAAVRFEAGAGVIELWVSTPGGAISERISGEGARLSDWVLVLRTTEALRAHGLDLGPEPPLRESVEDPARAPSAPSASREKPAIDSAASSESPASPALAEPAKHSSLGAGLGLGVDLSPGGVPPESHLLANLHLVIEPIWTVKTFGWYPLSGSTVSGPEGKARVRTWLVAASVDAIVLASSRAELAFGGGYSIGVHDMRGDASAGYQGVRDRVVTSAPFARADVRFDLAASLWVDFAVLTGWSTPELSVRFGDRTAARWGRPWIGFGLSLESSLIEL